MARILLVCHQFFPRFYTGTETLTLEVADELRRRGHEICILTTEPILPGDSIPDTPYIKKEIYNDHQVCKLIIPHPGDPTERLNRESDDNLLIDLFEQTLNECNPDIVHAFHLMRITKTLVNSVKRRGIPVYITVTDFWLCCPTYQLVKYDQSLCTSPQPDTCFSCLLDLYSKGMNKIPWDIKLGTKYPRLAAIFNLQVKAIQNILALRIRRHQNLIREIDGVFWSNSFIRDLFHHNKLINENEFLVPFPIPERSRKLLDLEIPINNGTLKVAFIGTLRSTKGPQVLIDACRLIGSNHKNIEVSIWGASDNPAYEEDLKKRSEGIDWVHFKGTFPQEIFPEVLRDTHVVVIPSIWYENTPLTALSALAARRILVVSDMGGLTSLIEDGTTGYTFPAGDANKLAQILTQLASNPQKVNEISSKIQIPNLIQEYVDQLISVYNITE